jgi:hypothetical protein
MRFVIFLFTLMFCKTFSQNITCDIPLDEIYKFTHRIGVFQEMKESIDNHNNGMDVNLCHELKLNIFPDFVYNINKILGNGEFGTVFSSIEPNGDQSAVKVMFDGKLMNGLKNTLYSVKREVNMGNLFYGMGLAPKILNFGKKQFNNGITLHFIKMIQIDGIVKKYLQKNRTEIELEILVNKIFDVIIILKNNNMNHGDFHIGNIGYMIKDDGEMEIKLIDYGMSSHIECVELDILRFIRITHLIIKNPNRDILDRIIRKKSSELFGLTYPTYNGTNNIDKEFKSLETFLRNNLSI